MESRKISRILTNQLYCNSKWLFAVTIELVRQNSQSKKSDKSKKPSKKGSDDEGDDDDDNDDDANESGLIFFIFLPILESKIYSFLFFFIFSLFDHF